MSTVLVFGVVLLIAALISARAQRGILSTAVLFLMAGVVAGPGLLDLLSTTPSRRVPSLVAEVALFAVLFTDGMHLTLTQLRSAWRLPGRALFIGMPLTLVMIAALAHWVVGLPWPAAWLVGAALSPTDPVFAAALVGADHVPRRVRELLNIESGANDGLALPIIATLLAVNGAAQASFGLALGGAAMGVALGVAIAWCAVRLARARWFEVSGPYAPLGVLAIGLVVLGTTSLLHANEFLAAFAAGVTIASSSERARLAFAPVGELVSEVLKLGALLIFGAVLTPSLFATLRMQDYVFAGLVLVVARPAAMVVSLLGSRLERREIVAVAWFGPKGFASVFFGFLILEAGVPQAAQVFQLLALVIALSIVAHSSTDVLVARGFRGTREDT
ncbi:sodium:proton antiporter [Luteitalea sp. TBR-22]|uniref:cation:proton antiporter n=1 Tax=Luteitalea sp. TBR-22 TaxID=2802971 RepID=UPI001EF6CC90|nr:cation:proton antiporter [Luteitalea sp. TBR-22]